MLLLVLFDLSILYQYTVLYMINKYKIGIVNVKLVSIV